MAMVPVGGRLSTTTVIDVVAVFPAASRARAANTCEAFDAVVVFHVRPYGAVTSSAPRFAPSSRNCTPITPTLSAAFAETLTAAPVTIAPSDGAVKAMVGGITSDGGGDDPSGVFMSA